MEVGEWIRFPESIHELYAHLAQFIGKSDHGFALTFYDAEISEANGNRGLKNISEENLEVRMNILFWLLLFPLDKT